MVLLAGMEFCPTCAMLLQYEPARSGKKSRLFCPTCPYVYPINAKVIHGGLPPLPNHRRFVHPPRFRRLLDSHLELWFQIVKKQRLPKKKEVEAIFSWEEAMRSAPKTQGEKSRTLFLVVVIFREVSVVRITRGG